MSVLIVGGGIGGLTTAVALRHVGITAHVYERAPELREVGAGFTIWSNAMKGLREIGLEGKALALGAELKKFQTLSPNGKVIDTEKMESIYSAVGATSICIHRADLLQILAEALPSEQIQTGKECVGVEQNDESVTLKFSDGAKVEGEIAIGADGINSAVRASLFGTETPRYAGYYCYRAIAETNELPPDEAIFGMAKGAQLGFFPFGREGKTYWFVCPNAPITRGESESTFDHKTFLSSIADRLPSHLGQIIRNTPTEDLIIGNVLDRPPRKEWGIGRVTLLGDAIHPTTPNLGQGACMAIEDGIVLADAIRRADNYITALRQYEQKRRKRTAMIARQSWRIGKIYQYENPLLIHLRTLMFRLPIAGWIGRKTQQRLLSSTLPELRDMQN
ncbi:MAG: FAD-dependent monooxygenase [Candidatus Kapaibacterium sp.]